MSWFYLALLAPLLYAITILIDDNLLRHVYRNAHVATIISGCFGILPASLILLLGQGQESIAGPLIGLSILGGFLLVVSYYFYFRGFETAEPSVVAALFCLTPVAIPFFAHFIVDERLSLLAICGFTAVVAAAFLYSLTDIKKFTVSKALVPVLTSALLIDTVSVANKYIYARADFYTAYIYFSIGMFIGGLVFLALAARPGADVGLRKVMRSKSLGILTLIVCVELFNLAAEFLHDRALSLGPVSLVNALENLQPLYILLISVTLFPFFPRFFREAQSGSNRLKVVLSVVLVAGAYLVTQ